MRATTHAGDEARLVEDALHDGIETLVVAGGDGTWSKCAVPLARAGSPARMALLAAGTGNDFAENLRISARDPMRLARLIAEGATERRVDLGRVNDTWFLNVAGFGFDVAVLKRSLGWRRLRGPAVYLISAIQELVDFPGLELELDGSPGRRLMAVFSNGARFGGAFRIAPDALVDDGSIDAILVDDAPALTRLGLLLRALRGTHRGHPRVTHRREARYLLRFNAPPAFETDGELCRASSEVAEVATVPGALRVVDA